MKALRTIAALFAAAALLHGCEPDPVTVSDTTAGGVILHPQPRHAATAKPS